MERLAEQPWSSCYTYQVSAHSADVLNKLDTQRRDGARFCDVVLRVGDESFPAHRAVLAACSDYFASVLGEARELEMHTISPRVFKDILDFAYTSRIVVRLESFPELLTAAQFLLMRSVVDICQEVIKQSNLQILLPPGPPDAPCPEEGPDAVLPAHCVKRGRGRPKKAAGSVVVSAGAPRARSPEQLQHHPAPPPPAAPVPPTPVLPLLLVENGGGGGITDAARRRERTRRHVGCDICGKVFRDVYHLNRHKLSHSGEKPYPCPVCGLRFKRKDRMSYHLRSHDGSVGKPYVCQSCGKGFSRPDHLNGHIKQVHTSERPHKCQICNASFATRDRLRSHLACHEDKIPCHVCGKFLRAAYMTDHLKKHTEGPHNYCAICNKGFSTASYLKVHIKTHHGSSLLPVTATHTYPEPRESQTPNGGPYHSRRQCAVEDLCASRRLLVTFPEAEGRIRGLTGPPVLPPPGAPSLSLQPELLLAKPGGAPYFWECRAAGVPGFPSQGPSADGQDEPNKCPHQDSESSDTSFGELSDNGELKVQPKPAVDGLESFSYSGSTSAGHPAEGSREKADCEKKHICADCGHAFRTKSYLKKHRHRIHGGMQKGLMGELPPSLGSPFSPQQNMSLLESFGFQIVQSAFASSLADSEAGHSSMGIGSK